jgi:hypothetical protein
MNLYVFRWTRRNRIPTSTIEESEVVSGQPRQCRRARVQVFRVGPKNVSMKFALSLEGRVWPFSCRDEFDPFLQRGLGYASNLLLEEFPC